MNEEIINSSAQVTSLLRAKSTIETIKSNLDLIIRENESTSNAIDEIILDVKKQKDDIGGSQNYSRLITDIDELVSKINSVTNNINSDVKKSKSRAENNITIRTGGTNVRPPTMEKT